VRRGGLSLARAAGCGGDPRSYLRFFNHKLSNDAIIPITDRLVAQIRRQQQHLRERFPTLPSILLPRIRKNPDGELPFLCSALHERLRRWLSDCDVRDAAGQPVRVTAHQFRHTVGTRMINTRSRWTPSSGCLTTPRRR
jgi:integrase